MGEDPLYTRATALGKEVKIIKLKQGARDAANGGSSHTGYQIIILCNLNYLYTRLLTKSTFFLLCLTCFGVAGKPLAPSSHLRGRVRPPSRPRALRRRGLKIDPSGRFGGWFDFGLQGQNAC